MHYGMRCSSGESRGEQVHLQCSDLCRRPCRQDCGDERVRGACRRRRSGMRGRAAADAHGRPCAVCRRCHVRGGHGRWTLDAVNRGDLRGITVAGRRQPFFEAAQHAGARLDVVAVAPAHGGEDFDSE